MNVDLREHPRRMSRRTRWAITSLFVACAAALALGISAGFIIRAVNTGDWFLLLPAGLGVAIVFAFFTAAILDLQPSRSSRPSRSTPEAQTA